MEVNKINVNGKLDVEVFRSTFNSRTDVVAKFWKSRDDKRTGFSPICRNEWKPGMCQKNRSIEKSCDDCENQKYLELSDDLIIQHFNGEITLGMFPLLVDNTCNFIAIDFDNHDGSRDPLADIERFYETCQVIEIPCYVLRSRSGRGFHIYIFFSLPVPAWKARLVTFELLKEAQIFHGEENLSSFDRMFPNQDEHGGKGLGNLIAMPFQGACLKNGNTLFVDPDSGFSDPFPDQSFILQDIKKIDEKILDSLIDDWKIARPQVRPNANANNTSCSSREGWSNVISFPKAEYLPILAGCGFIKNCQENAPNLPEPEWWGMVSIVSRCNGGDELVHNLSKPYPNYCFQETQKKIMQAEKMGPHTCQYIMDKLNGFFCASCSNYGKITSPISLGSPSQQTRSQCAQVITDLNEKHAIVMSGGRCVVLNESHDPTLNRTEITLSTTADFRLRYSNRKILNPKMGQGQPKETTIANVWLDSPFRRQYDGIIFSPQGDVPCFFNLYRGMSVQPIKGNWSTMREHIFNIICNGNGEIFEWVLAWLARIVQNPGGERPGTCIALRGSQGSGKGAFINGFGKIFGGHYLQILNQNQVVGRFNSHLKDALLVFLDESFWQNDRAAEGILRGMITEPYNFIEPKGKDAFTVKNHVNIVMASNHTWMVPAGLEERRFCVLDVSEKMLGNTAYFNSLYAEMENGGREAMLYDLLRLDISKINLRAVPRTDALFDQIENSMTTIQKFWYHRLREGSITEKDHAWFDGAPIETNKIHSDYLEFGRMVNEKSIKVLNQFSKEISNICPGVARKRLSSSMGSKKTSVMIFPPIDECRRQFERMVKKQLPWDDDGEITDPKLDDSDQA